MHRYVYGSELGDRIFQSARCTGFNFDTPLSLEFDTSLPVSKSQFLLASDAMAEIRYFRFENLIFRSEMTSYEKTSLPDRKFHFSSAKMSITSSLNLKNVGTEPL